MYKKKSRKNARAQHDLIGASEMRGKSDHKAKRRDVFGAKKDGLNDSVCALGGGGSVA